MAAFVGDPDCIGHAEAYLHRLFDGLPGLIEIRSFEKNSGRRRQTFCESIKHALQAVEKDAPDHNVYVGLATRGTKLNEKGRLSGEKTNLIACRVLWVDRDGLTEEGAREEYEVELERFPIPPTLRVDSGGGEHSYFELAEPVLVDTDDAIAQHELRLKGLCDALNADRSTTDATRILRVPSTTNFPNAEKRAKGRVEARCRIVAGI